MKTDGRGKAERDVPRAGRVVAAPRARAQVDYHDINKFSTTDKYTISMILELHSLSHTP